MFNHLGRDILAALSAGSTGILATISTTATTISTNLIASATWGLQYQRTGFAVNTGGALASGAFAAFQLTLDAAVDAASEAVPANCVLGLLNATTDTAAGGATQLIWYLSYNVGGTLALTKPETVDIAMPIGGTAGGCGSRLDVPYRTTGDSTAGSLWLQARCNAGTVNITTARLFFQR